MTLQEFCESVEQLLFFFKDTWIREAEQDPENWPMDMEEEEWHEQVVCFLSKEGIE